MVSNGNWNFGDHVFHWFGLDGGAFYNGYSGVWPAILGLSLFGALWAAYRRIKCSTYKCPWPARHSTNGGHKICHRHWNRLNGRPAKFRHTFEHILEEHEKNTPEGPA